MDEEQLSSDSRPPRFSTAELGLITAIAVFLLATMMIYRLHGPSPVKIEPEETVVAKVQPRYHVHDSDDAEVAYVEPDHPEPVTPAVAVDAVLKDRGTTMLLHRGDAFEREPQTAQAGPDEISMNDASFSRPTESPILDGNETPIIVE